MSMGNSSRRNPFDNPFLALLVHVTATMIFFGTAYFSLRSSTFLPFAMGAVVLGCMEGLWIYFRLRK